MATKGRDARPDESQRDAHHPGDPPVAVGWRGRRSGAAKTADRRRLKTNTREQRRGSMSQLTRMLAPKVLGITAIDSKERPRK